MTPKEVLFIEPFYKGSHKYFLDNLVKYSKHKITIQTKNGVFWKWKFLESAIAKRLELNQSFDVIMGSNMLNLAPWIGINRKVIGDAKLALYFHENQLTYPQNDSEKNKNEFFGFQNLTSCFCADKVLFNSSYHRNSFIEAGEKLSQKLPDNIPSNFFETLKNNTSVLPVGLHLGKLDSRRRAVQNEVPVILWNHRWEFDKNPDLFLKTLIELKEEQVDFKLIMLGSAPKKVSSVFLEAKEVLSENIIQWGRVETFNEYADLVWMADILPVTSLHDFFGISVLEAVYCNTLPLLPKRCAYPDHFPIDQFSDLYFESDSDFKDKLRDQLETSKFKFNFTELRSIISQYSWNNVANKFDNFISEI